MSNEDLAEVSEGVTWTAGSWNMSLVTAIRSQMLLCF